MKEVHPIALFRLSILGQLISREYLAHGELKAIIQQIAATPHLIPDSKRTYLSEKTIEAWYYTYKREGVDGLAPVLRSDAGLSKLPLELQEAIIQAKRDNPGRSINQIITLLELNGTVTKGTLKKSSIHRLLVSHGISKRKFDNQEPEEHRSFVAEFANDLWQGDVMHGPKVMINGRWRKVYLVSLMDDASRLMTHSAFHLAEGAVEIESVLKQAVLKRGLAKKLIIDNGAAYRAQSMQGICARLGIHLVYCRPYHPEGKGKLERWHRTVREQFISEIDFKQIRGLDDLNARLWAWLESIYHVTTHSSLDGISPLERYRQDLSRIRPLGMLANNLDALFHHRHERKVRKNGTVSFEGCFFEVPYELAGATIVVVVDPHTGQPITIESKAGKSLGDITPLDAVANNQRRRCRSNPDQPILSTQPAESTVELTYEQYNKALKSTSPNKEM